MACSRTSWKNKFGFAMLGMVFQCHSIGGAIFRLDLWHLIIGDKICPYINKAAGITRLQSMHGTTWGQSQTITNKAVALASCRLVESSSQSVVDEMVTDVFHKMAAGKAGGCGPNMNKP